MRISFLLVESEQGATVEGSFETVRAGLRMLLKTARTWEQEISTKGNAADAWEELINGEQLGYMTLLRNLLTVGISPTYYDAVLMRIVD